MSDSDPNTLSTSQEGGEENATFPVSDLPYVGDKEKPGEAINATGSEFESLGSPNESLSLNSGAISRAARHTGESQLDEESEQEVPDQKSSDVDVGQTAHDISVTEGADEIVKKHRKEEKSSRLPDDYYYDIEKLQAKPITTNEEKFPLNTLCIRSFGYDCNKRGNLHLLDNKTIMFTAGCYVELIDLPSGKHKYIRTSGGYSVGALAVHPSKQYFAVGEKGDMPSIVIYEYPSLKPYRMLKGGTQRAFAYLDFSSEGDLLASLGSNPDFMLTIWDWKDEKILLRSKASSQEVFKVSFSKDLKGQLTTAGIGHI
ncbi:unnamed protein product, partial [Didymodactylos carnosus]